MEALLGLFGPSVSQLKARGDVEGLLGLLSSGDEKKRQEAEWALVGLGPPVIQALIARAHDVPLPAGRVLSRIGDPAVKPVSAALFSGNPHMCVALILLTSERAKYAFSHLCDAALSHPSRIVRVACRRQLDEILGPYWFGEDLEVPGYPPSQETRALDPGTVANAIDGLLKTRFFAARVANSGTLAHELDWYNTPHALSPIRSRKVRAVDDSLGEARKLAAIAEGCLAGCFRFCEARGLDSEAVLGEIPKTVELIREVRAGLHWGGFEALDHDGEDPPVTVKPNSRATVLTTKLLQATL